MGDRVLVSGVWVHGPYLLTNLALAVFMWSRHRQSFSALRHVAIPALRPLTLIVPFIELRKRGQSAPTASSRISRSRSPWRLM